MQARLFPFFSGNTVTLTAKWEAAKRRTRTRAAASAVYQLYELSLLALNFFPRFLAIAM